MKKQSLDRFQKRTAKEAKTITKDLEKHLLKTQLQLEADGKRNATDDFYQALTRSGRTRSYKLTGRLRNSINSRIKRQNNNVSVILQAGGFNGGASLVYAAPLEFGTVDGRIKPYLFLGRAVQKAQRSMVEGLQNFLKLELGEL